MARQPALNRSLSVEDGNTSRRASIETSNTNVFSDAFAVDPAESIGGSSPTASISSRPEELDLERSHDDDNTREYTPAGLPGIEPGRFSTAKRPLPVESLTDPRRPISISSPSIADTRRTLSTSSRFSIPRSQSPYQGPSAPSQPYGLYPQATRASSIASESTFQPVEQPFIPQGGPEHPYGMYPQNTVPEEDDRSDTHIVMGFPVPGQSFQSGSSSSGNEVGDIVGSDGHVEQLPPYSRYADNVIAKGDMDRIDPQTSTVSQPSASASTIQPGPPAGSDVELTAVGTDAASEEVARKEGLTEKKRRRTCCGLPIWTVVIVAAIVIIAAVVGGVIGGVVGNQKGADRALASGATTTVWLDADPAQTGPLTPACPTGHYSVPLNQSQEIDQCIIDPQFAHTWECLDFALLGINIFEGPNQGNGSPLSVVFDDYSVRPQLFKYGPQPPDFNGSAFEMQPYKDKEDDELGIALFFSVLFDKLTIIRADDLSPPPDTRKRSLPAKELPKRGYGSWNGDDGADYLEIGDKPWYCFWNSTVNEFWVFLEKDHDGSDTETSATITSATHASTSTHYGYSSGFGYPMEMTTSMPSTTTPPSSEPTDESWPKMKLKRQAATIGSSSSFPRLVKMVEKRKPDSNVQPYCQQMQVLNNWQIVAIPDIPIICIEEDEYNSSTTGSGKLMNKRWADSVQQMGSNCICEWFSYGSSF